MARITIDVEVRYGVTHTNSRRYLNQDLTLAQAVAAFPFTDQWNRLVMQRPQDWIHDLTFGAAAALESAWEGHGGGFTPGVQLTSRNVLVLHHGWVGVNYPIPGSFGGVTGRGNNWSGTNGNCTSYIVPDETNWKGGATDPIMRGSTVGSSTYHESAIFEKFRIYGGAGQWFIPSSQRDGLHISTAGEVFIIRDVYINDCNGNNIRLDGAGPGKISNVSLFDGNLHGLFVNGVNSLGNLQIDHISGDNNGGALVYHKNAGAVTILNQKCETGLSNSRGKEFKGQVPIIVEGWCDVLVHQLTSAVNPVIDSVIHMNNTANPSRVRVLQYTGWNAANLVTNWRTNKRFYIGTDNSLASFRPMEILADAVGSVESRVAVSYPGGWTDPNARWVLCAEGPYNADQRLGRVSSAAEYDYVAGTPVWDPTNGGSTVPPPPPPPPPPPTTCTWITGPWGAWSTCNNGTQTRTRTVVSSVAGCTPTDPVPATQESQACTVPPPPPTTGLLYEIDFLGKNAAQLPGCLAQGALHRQGSIQGQTITTTTSTTQKFTAPLAGVKRIVLKGFTPREATSWRILNNRIRASSLAQYCLEGTNLQTVLANWVVNQEVDLTITFATPQTITHLFGSDLGTNTHLLSVKRMEFWSN